MVSAFITRNNVRDNFMSNTQNAKTKLFSFRIERKPFFSNFNPWWISWPSYKVLENRRQCCSRYLWYINESKVEIWIYWLSDLIEWFIDWVTEDAIFFCFWRGLLMLGLMTSSVWIIKFDLKKVKFRPSSC